MLQYRCPSSIHKNDAMRELPLRSSNPARQAQRAASSKRQQCGLSCLPGQNEAYRCGMEHKTAGAWSVVGGSCVSRFPSCSAARDVQGRGVRLFKEVSGSCAINNHCKQDSNMEV